MKDRKKLILDTAEALFYEKGFEQTSIQDILDRTFLSKGGFYHYFHAKDDLLEELALLLDKQYEKLKIPAGLSVYDKLIWATTRVYRYIEEELPVEILALVYSSQVVKKGDKYLLNHRRYYFKFLTNLIAEGQKKGEFRTERSSRELVRFYAMQERAVLYDWCISGGNYPLSGYGIEMLDFFVRNIRAENSPQA